MDGLTMTNVISKKYPAKVIVLTGIEDMRKDAFHKGAKAYIRKPFGIDVLLEIVNKVMTEGIAGFI
jgi:CheY-like chemotaxis protein